jgi:hypothetical protein
MGLDEMDGFLRPGERVAFMAVDLLQVSGE